MITVHMKSQTLLTNIYRDCQVKSEIRYWKKWNKHTKINLLIIRSLDYIYTKICDIYIKSERGSVERIEPKWRSDDNKNQEFNIENAHNNYGIINAITHVKVFECWNTHLFQAACKWVTLNRCVSFDYYVYVYVGKRDKERKKEGESV